MQSSAALLDSREMLKAIVDATTAVIYIKDIAGRYVLINRRFEDLFHVTSEVARGKTDHDVFPKETADAFRGNDLEVQRSGAAVEFEECVSHDDGEHIYISIKFPLVRATGEIYAVCGISTDITARKRAEAELESTKHSLERLVDERTADILDVNRRLTAEIAERVAAAERLRGLIETANEGVWVIDATGDTRFANHRMAEMLGCTPTEMIGRSFYEFTDAQRRVEAERDLSRRLTGITEQQDFEFRRKDGSHVWTLVATNPFHDPDGTVSGVLAMVTDITERKHAEQHQTLLLRELDHRVKNTLATVLALADLTMESVDSIGDFRAAFAGRVQAMARTHEALARAQWQDVPFDEVLAIVLAPFVSRDAVRIVASGDPLRISAVATAPLALALNELGTNALKHGALSSHDGGVAVEWRLTEDGELSLSWLERGGPSADAPSDRGTGLRLIRGLIEYELEGRLTVDFAPQGLSCRITIPASAIAQANR